MSAKVETVLHGLPEKVGQWLKNLICKIEVDHNEYEVIEPSVIIMSYQNHQELLSRIAVLEQALNNGEMKTHYEQKFGYMYPNK